VDDLGASDLQRLSAKDVATYGFSYVCLICHVTTNEPIVKLHEASRPTRKVSLQPTVSVALVQLAQLILHILKAKT